MAIFSKEKYNAKSKTFTMRWKENKQNTNSSNLVFLHCDIRMEMDDDILKNLAWIFPKKSF